MRIGRTLPPAASPIYIRDIINGLKGLLRGQEEIERFRSEIKDFYGVKHCFLVSSGKAALTLILRALHDLHPERDEVLIPAFCCYSIPSAIIRAGLKVKLCDVDPDTLDYDFDQLNKILSEYKPGQPNQPANRLLAIIPVYLFGLCADVERVRSMVDDPSVSIIEDCAQVLGATRIGKKIGTVGDVSFFSLGRGKALSTVEGGIIITNRDDIAAKIEARHSELSNYSIPELIKLVTNAVILILFQKPSLFWLPKSLPFLKVGDTFYDAKFKNRKLSAFQAGMAKTWKIKLDEFQAHRKIISKQWNSLVKTADLKKYSATNGHIPEMLRFPVRIKDKKLWASILKNSNTQGLGIMFTYPTAINGIEGLEETFKGQSYFAAERLPGQLVTLPIHPLVSEEDIGKIGKLLGLL